jgi:hypothetical protein
MTEKPYTIYKSRKDLFIDNFIGGISWGVGSVLGATVIISIIGIVIAQTRSIPLLGNIVEVITTEIQKQQETPLFRKK